MTARTCSPSHLVLVLEDTYDMDGRVRPTARDMPRRAETLEVVVGRDSFSTWAYARLGVW